MMREQCVYYKDEQSCKTLTEMNNKSMSSPDVKCLAAADIAIAGIVLGDGIPDAIAGAVARKYVAGAATACISTLVTGG